MYTYYYSSCLHNIFDLRSTLGRHLQQSQEDKVKHYVYIRR